MSNLAETYYYQLYNSILLGNVPEAKMYLEFLREEFETNEETFELLKKDHRWDHLVDLSNSIEKNQVISKNLNIEQKTHSIYRQEEETAYSKQDDLVKAIMLCQNDLSICLGTESEFHCTCAEKETIFGRVDLVAQDRANIYPIEVKKNGAYHDVIGQINKYIVHFKLGLINRTYENVIGVVIANSFDAYILNELYNVGAVPIKYKFRSEKKVEFEKL